MCNLCKYKTVSHSEGAVSDLEQVSCFCARRSLTPVLPALLSLSEPLVTQWEIAKTKTKMKTKTKQKRREQERETKAKQETKWKRERKHNTNYTAWFGKERIHSKKTWHDKTRSNLPKKRSRMEQSGSRDNMTWSGTVLRFGFLTQFGTVSSRTCLQSGTV